MKVDYFAHINNGKIVTVVHARPDHELLSEQMALSKNEFDVLSKIPHTMTIHDAIAHLVNVSLRLEMKSGK